VIVLPVAFTQRIVESFGDAGAAWLERLPSVLDGAAERWGLTLGEPFELSYNYVVAATRGDGARVVLKVGVPDHEVRSEIAALRHYDGRGCVQLIDSDAVAGLLLLERIEPGTPLADLDDDDAMTAIAADVMLELWRPAPTRDVFAFRTVDSWAAGLAKLRARFNGGTGPLPAGLVDAAERTFAELFASAGERVLLHGDLHHWNILRAQRAPWLALDPKGVIGERAYEAGALLRNHVLHLPDPARALARRLDVLSERLAIDRERLRAYGMAHAVLSAWWSVEDHGAGWEGAIAIAEALR
jgi:streptomycin 6-kinase